MGLRIASWNVNGIRACARNGFFDWLKAAEADVVLLQEVRAETSQMQEEWLAPFGFGSAWLPAQKKGYSGVGIYYRKSVCGEKPELVRGLGFPEFDSEGRVLGVAVGKNIFLSAYFPNSQREGLRLGYKLDFCAAFLEKIESLRKQGYGVVIGGDFNIAHTELDLANPKQNLKNAGFLPEERAWLSDFVGRGYLDTFRMFEQRGGYYSWWSNRPGIRERNIGWRIDYNFVSPELQHLVRGAQIHPLVFGSDHCPVTLDLDV